MSDYEMCPQCGQPMWDDCDFCGWPFDDERCGCERCGCAPCECDNCTVCGGTGCVPTLDYEIEMGDMYRPCLACKGTGDRKHQTEKAHP